jgi:hypothetical protein
LGLAKVTIVKKFGKNTSLCTCSGVTAYCVKSIVMYMLYAVQDETHNDVFLPNFLTIVTLARPKYELPDDGHRPKHVGAF